jgi:hypothetical protein
VPDEMLDLVKAKELLHLALAHATQALPVRVASVVIVRLSEGVWYVGGLQEGTNLERTALSDELLEVKYLALAREVVELPEWKPAGA